MELIGNIVLALSAFEAGCLVALLLVYRLRVCSCCVVRVFLEA